jgi:hypothetical protein
VPWWQDERDTKTPTPPPWTAGQPDAPVEAGSPAGQPEAPVEAGSPAGRPEASVDAGSPAGQPEAPVEAGWPEAPVEADKPAGQPEAWVEAANPAGQALPPEPAAPPLEARAEVEAAPPKTEAGWTSDTPAAAEPEADAAAFFRQPFAAPAAEDPEGPPTEDLQDTQARLAAMQADEEIDEGSTGLRPRHLAAIVIIPLVVFGLSLLVASLLVKPKGSEQRPAAAVTATPQAQPSAAASAAATPTTTATASPPPTAVAPAATPFQLVPSPVRASAAFTQGTGACPGFPPGPQFSDSFTFTTNNGTLTLKQLSTNEVTSGPVQPDGSFAVKAANSSESYTGKISGLNATASYEHNAAGCRQTYTVNFRFQP